PAYYAERPPRNVFYYLLYPLLFPYWLLVGRARRELGLYRSFGVMTVVVLAATGTVEYLRHWYPHLALTTFAGASIGLFIVQIFVTMVMVMPVVTTAVMLRGRWKALIGVSAFAALFTVLALLFGMHQTAVMTLTRIRERTKEEKQEVSAAFDA